MLSKVFLLLALAARASAFASLPKAREEASADVRSNAAGTANSRPMATSPSLPVLPDGRLVAFCVPV